MGEEIEGILSKLRPEPSRGITSRRARDGMHGDEVRLLPSAPVARERVKEVLCGLPVICVP